MIKMPRSYIFIFLSAILLFLDACGGGGGSSSGSSSSVSSISTGRETFIGTNSLNGVTLTFLANPNTQTFSYFSTSGAQGGGFYSQSGGNLTVTSGTEYEYPCTSTCTTSSISGTLQLSGNNISGTLYLSQSGVQVSQADLSLTADSSLNQTNIDLTSFTNQTLSSNSSYQCSSPDLNGYNSFLISGSITLISGCEANPNNLDVSITTCSVLGTDCSPGSFLTSNGISIPTNALVYFATCTNQSGFGTCPNTSPLSAGILTQASSGSNVFNSTNYWLATTISSSCSATLISSKSNGLFFDANGKTFITGSMSYNVSPSAITCSGTTYQLFSGSDLYQASSALF